LRWLAAGLLLALMAGLLAQAFVRNRMLQSAEDSARTGVQLRTALLDSEIARYRLLPLALADDRDVVGALAGDKQAQQALDRKLEALAAETGATVIYVVAPGGKAIAASNWRSPQSFVGTNYSFRRYFRQAVQDGSASQFALGSVSRQPGLYLARRTAAGGVVVVKLEFDAVEAEWAKAGGTTFVTDRQGVVLVTSRPDWRFATSRPLSSAEEAAIRTDIALGDKPLMHLPPPGANGPVVSGGAPAAEPGWHVVLQRPATDVHAPARIAGLVAAATVFALVMLGWALRERGLLRARRTTELEKAVADRTADLQLQMDERAASEARAAELREGLRQANRLATLGQVTASVAHETAQPVAAIRTYAQTSATLLEQGRNAAVQDNLLSIARLADRIGSVTSELRGFARRGAGTVRPVSLAEVIDGAMLILKDQLRGVRLDRPAVPPTLMVMGGKVRLEQVLVNLMQNAIDALGDRNNARITMQVGTDADEVLLTIADNGPGIPPDVAERLFTPFVTSRANGLGLGLVISQDIMADLGGSLRLRPDDAGATFEIRMQRA
jgi:two-component system C4-dicarboxylate transport sensor histidine kinase DctB